MAGLTGSALAQWRIAVVDDDTAVRGALVNLLKSVGYGTLAFDSAEAFLASGQAGAAHCAVFDVCLGGMSGFALHEHLAGAGVALPVILVSGDDGAAVQARALTAGALAFLRKPIDVDALLDIIGVALARSASGK